MTGRPSAAEKADAMMRLLDEFDTAHEALTRAEQVLRERCEPGSFTSPLFPAIGARLTRQVEAARKALWSAAVEGAPQYLQAQREMARSEP